MTAAAGIEVEPWSQAVIVTTPNNLCFIELHKSSLEKGGLICIGIYRSKRSACARCPAANARIGLGKRRSHSKQEQRRHGEK